MPPATIIPALCLTTVLAFAVSASAVSIDVVQHTLTVDGDGQTNYVEFRDRAEGTYTIVVFGCAPTAPGTGMTCTALVGDQDGNAYVAVSAGCDPAGECPYVTLDVDGDARRFSVTPHASEGCLGFTVAGVAGTLPAPLVCLSLAETGPGCTVAGIGVHDATTGQLLASAGAGPCASPPGACVSAVTVQGTRYVCENVVASVETEPLEVCVTLSTDDNGTIQEFPVCVRE